MYYNEDDRIAFRRELAMQGLGVEVANVRDPYAGDTGADTGRPYAPPTGPAIVVGGYKPPKWTASAITAVPLVLFPKGTEPAPATKPASATIRSYLEAQAKIREAELARLAEAKQLERERAQDALDAWKAKVSREFEKNEKARSWDAWEERAAAQKARAAEYNTWKDALSKGRTGSEAAQEGRAAREASWQDSRDRAGISAQKMKRAPAPWTQRAAAEEAEARWTEEARGQANIAASALVRARAAGASPKYRKAVEAGIKEFSKGTAATAMERARAVAEKEAESWW